MYQQKICGGNELDLVKKLFVSSIWGALAFFVVKKSGKIVKKILIWTLF
jgi:hypothetical protein